MIEDRDRDFVMTIEREGELIVKELDAENTRRNIEAEIKQDIDFVIYCLKWDDNAKRFYI